MTKPKFTPGPWHVENHGLWVCDSSRVVLVLSDRPYGDETDRADTNLIAAAPEMYKVLDKVLGTLKFHHPTMHYSISCIESVLRKARGESEVSE